MKCPKCHYLSFDPEPRCKNCGFTLGLEALDLAFTPADGQAKGPLADLALREGGAETVPGRESTVDAPQDDFGRAPRVIGRPVLTPRAPRKLALPTENAAPTSAARLPAPATTELPLFVKGTAGVDAESTTARRDTDNLSPEMSLPVVPVEPRVSPDVPRRVPDQVPSARAIANRRLGPLDRDLLEDLQRFEQTELQAERDKLGVAARRVSPGTRSGAVRRLGAAAADATLIGGLSVGTVGMTLRWCDLAWAQIGVLPPLPTAAFLLLIVFGYLLMFTAAGGQTLGKMLFGIRVVGASALGDAWEPLSVRQVVYREVLALPSVLALGVGFAPALLGGGRALHDRLAHTRVVRV